MNIYTKKRMMKWLGDASNQFVVADQPQGTYTVEVVSGLNDGDYFTVGVLTDCDSLEQRSDYYFFDDVISNDDIKALTNILSNDGARDLSFNLLHFYIFKVDTTEKSGYKEWLNYSIGL